MSKIWRDYSNPEIANRVWGIYGGYTQRWDGAVLFHLDINEPKENGKVIGFCDYNDSAAVGSIMSNHEDHMSEDLGD